MPGGINGPVGGPPPNYGPPPMVVGPPPSAGPPPPHIRGPIQPPLPGPMHGGHTRK
jgi:hypothetical protein